ncbi:MAG: DUF285 domain-containing protein, partial [Saccharospirillaceae bacterium]|nr:BspA family leucine-rich repeat surface protein [Pseudomonadales bacterium]NRB77922.1 DUF285 domain-containing protein [Saccharospirillaceae bacterium]
MKHILLYSLFISLLFSLSLSAYCNLDNGLSVSIESNTEESIKSPSAFITKWKTNNEGVSDINQIYLEVNPEFSYDFNVDWGDGQSDINITSEITHTYNKAGKYTLKITGIFPQFYFSNFPSKTDAKKLLSIERWGDNVWLSMFKAFYFAENMVLNAKDVPDLSLVVDMSYMFYEAININQDLSEWDVSSVTDMNHIFSQAISFNQNLSNWDVSSVTDMSKMFAGAIKFDQNLSSWDVSSATNMTKMFVGADSFNQNISDWNVSSVTSMSGMFKEASNYNQDLSKWDVSSVTDMNSMFLGATSFNQNLSKWDVSSVTQMYKTFECATSF